MWKIIYHNAGTLRGSWVARQFAKDYLDDMVKETTQDTVKFTYTDYTGMSDIVRNGEVIGAIVYVPNN